jgi:lysozyme family protein
MIDFDKAFEIIISPAFEGSKTTNTPGDLGGKTRCGLTQRNYSSYRYTKGLPDQDIELADISEISSWYRTYCWEDSGADKIFLSGRDKLAFTIFNCAVNRSYTKAVSMLQEALGIDMAHVTGHYGPITGDMVSKCNEMETVNKYLTLLTKYYVNHVIERPDQKRFIHDWLGRVNSVAKVVESDYHTDPHQLD